MILISRRSLLLAGTGLAVAGAAAAQGSWPQKPISLIVPFPAGGGTDVTARATARILSDALGQAVVVANKPGAAGAIGTEQGARAAADGYTLVFGTTGTHTVNQTLYPKLGYDPVTSFEPVSLICRYNNVLVAHPSFPAADFDGMLREVRSHPGKYFYAISVNGSSGHLAMELLKTEAKLQIEGVPYKGAAEAMSDFMSGRVPLICDTVINQLQNIRAGKVKALATTGPQRSPALPEVPTVATAGGLPGWQAVGWAGVFAPAGTPAAIVDRLSVELRKSVNSLYYDALAKSGLELVASTPEETRAFVISEAQKWRRLIRTAGIVVS